MQNKNGQSLVEIAIVIGLTSILLPALIVGLLASREGKAQQKERLEAVALLRETTEAVRSVREGGWTTFAVNGTFHPVISGSSWILSPGTDMINGFVRTVNISDVSRDSSGTIVSTGGTLDPSTKKIITTIAWNTPFSSSVQSTIYLSRFDNLSYTETTEAEFNQGTKTGVTITNTNGGEVVLGAGGGGNWCVPNLSITALDLPKNGVANGISAIEGQVFAGTGDNASGVSFANVGISNATPPVPTILGTFNNYKTNDVFGETNYGYIATDTNSKEIVIIDFINLPYTEVGYFDSPGNSDANSVFVSGTTGYMTAGSKLYNFNLSSKSGSRPLIDPDGVTLPGTGISITVVGNYVYVATNSSSELQIFDISNPSDLTIVGQADLNASADGARDIFVNQTATRAYVATSASSTLREFFIVDISTKTGNRPVISSYDSSGMDPKGVTIVPGNRAIIVGQSAEEYQVIDISNETSLVRCGGLNIDTGVNGVASVLESDGDAYSYIITGDATTELKIIEGGPGGLFASSGTFESATFDTGYQTALNRLSFSRTQPANTSITFQFASTDAISNSCSSLSFNYVGPDGTNATFFNDPGPIPFSDDAIGFENPARCVRYKAYLTTTDSFASPILQDITLNYSP